MADLKDSISVNLMLMIDHYAILGLKPGANIEEIKRAYRKLAMRFHPDRNDGNEFAEEWIKHINHSYEILSDSTKKMAYDLKLANEKMKANAQCPTYPKYYKKPVPSKNTRRHHLNLSKMTTEQLIVYAVLKLFFK